MHGKTPLLDAPTPAAWLRDHVEPRFEANDEEGAPAGRWLSLADLLADEAAVLRATHTKLLGDGVPGPAAATYVAGWFGGQLGWAVGFGLATAGVGFVVDPATVRWRQHPDGWCDRVDLGDASVVVPAGHPWAGQPGVTEGDPARAAVDALVAAVRPLLDACHGLARVGMAGLWNEIGDSLGTSIAYEVALPVVDDAVAALRAAVALGGVPWRAKPELRVVESRIGSRYVVRKGGCCLAYTEPGNATEEGLDTPHYCSTCSFRTWEDVQARQIDWLEGEITGTNEAHG